MLHYTNLKAWIKREILPPRVNDAANIIKYAYLGFLCSYTTQLHQFLKEKKEYRTQH